MENGTLITCPLCDKLQPFIFATKIDISVNPEYREKILENVFFDHQCAHCGEIYPVYHSVEYIDKERKLIINYVSNEQAHIETLQTYEEQKIGGQYNGYTIRVVSSPNALREKIRIFEMGLDDRVIEILKIVALNLISEADLIKTVEEVRCWVHDNGSFDIDVLGEAPGTMGLKKDFYDYINNKCKVLINKHAANDLEIDADWAIEFLDRYRLKFV